ncbi:hypothetical protein A0O32_2155 [Anoxybacillus flavithermus]|uniref:Uncharacterized protein n=1 Tax=Anoxybacillus flavithermus TaxID=33934 RepID=A0A178TAP2_9BACL|nr:hypothetical protein A0O32_2155 [Anoxybacillus flavithermus]OAO79712.1 hypothetical protein TAF16_1427 [Anoxybacillus flavithermus]
MKENCIFLRIVFFFCLEYFMNIPISVTRLTFVFLSFL